MRQTFATLALLVAFAFPTLGGDSDKPKDAKEALQALQDYIGGWKGNGTSEKNRTEIWKETSDWSWRFKGKDIWLSVEMKDSKLYKSAEMRYLPNKGQYEFTLVDKKDKKAVFLGQVKKGSLVLERTDAESNDTHQLKINTAGGGIRLVYTYSIKPDGRTLFNKQWTIGYTKEGESFATAAKKTECVVTGGLGTIPVSYMGTTYYVCCSGCRDAFNENPAQIVKEYLARKKKGQ
jgi:hypothetical protein